MNENCLFSKDITDEIARITLKRGNTAEVKCFKGKIQITEIIRKNKYYGTFPEMRETETANRG